MSTVQKTRSDMGAFASSAVERSSRASTPPARHLPRVTVIIPCYNYARWVADCLGSVLAQDGVDVDALVIDDGSTDGSAEIAAGLARDDARVTFVRHDRNIGHIHTFNEGLAHATGDYVVLISADDMLTRGSLARATAAMEARPDVGLVYGNPVMIYGADVAPARTRGRRTRVWDGPAWISAQCRRGTSCIYSPEVCVRASVHRAVGGYNPALPLAADLELWLRIASVSSIARVDSDQAYKRVHGRGMIQTSYGSLLADLRERRNAYDAFFRESGAALPHAQRDHRVARRHMAGEALEHVCLELARGEHVDDDPYVDFAHELLGVEIARLPQWVEYRFARGDAGPTLRDAALRYVSLRLDANRRYSWWRWRLTGT